MVEYKNIRIKKRGGGTRLQRVKVLKSGKHQFVKNLKEKLSRKKTSNPTKKKKKNNPNRSVRNTAKRSNILGTLFKFLRIGSFAAPGIIRYKDLKNATWSQEKCIGGALASYGGFTPSSNGGMRFDASILLGAWLPFLVTNLMTIGIPKLNGIIRRI